MTDTVVIWTLELSGATVRRWWSGEGELTLGGLVYEGTSEEQGALMNVTSVDFEADLPNRRTQIQASVTNESERRMSQQDLGFIQATVRWHWSTDRITWTTIPKFVQGYLSRPTMTDGILSAEIETFRGADLAVEDCLWSVEEQKRLYPDDTSFRQVGELQDGIDIAWPPPRIVTA